MALSYRGRLVLLGIIALLLGGSLLVRLFAMQVAGSAGFRTAAGAQIAARRGIHGPRGRILDRNGRELAAEEVGYELTVRAAAWRSTMHECPRCGQVRFYADDQTGRPCTRCKTKVVRVGSPDATQLARLLDMSAAELVQRAEARTKEVEDIVAKGSADLPPRLEAQEHARLWADYGWRPRRIARDVPYEVAREVELRPYRNPAFKILPVHTRRASGGREFVHILGQVRQDQVEVEGTDDFYVEMAVGVSGIEGAYDRVLRGEPGWLRILRDPRDGDERVVARQGARHGLDVRLTIATEDQALAVAALGETPGAFVVIDAEKGDVLAAVSAPSYEPGEYARELKRIQEQKERLGYWPRHHALLDGAFGDFHVPGSIVKPVTAVAALLSGVATPATRIYCDRHFRNRRDQPLTNLRCSHEHGDTDLHDALVRSCNVYFQTLQKEAIERGVFDRMYDTSRRFGFGLPTGIELEPSSFPDTYDPGRTWAEHIWMAIGQGEVKLSPAQVARAYAGLATGALPKLRLVAEVGDRPVPPQRTPLGIDDSVLGLVRAALVEVPSRGTAAGYGLERWPIAAKTGTAQLHGAVQNAWLAGFLPPYRGRPAIAFALVIFDTEENGAQACAPRLADFLRGFYAEGAQ